MSRSRRDKASLVPVKGLPDAGAAAGEGTEVLHAALGELVEEYLGGAEGLGEGMRRFLDAVNRAYWQNEADRKLMERAHELTIQRLMAAQDALAATHTARLEQHRQEQSESVSQLARALGKEMAERTKTEAVLHASKEQYYEIASRLRTMAHDLCLAEERERRRIASTLHDTVVQNLAFLKMKIEGMAGVRAGGDHAFTEIVDTLRSSIHELRTLMYEICPPVLYELGIEAAVESLARQMQARSGIRVSVEDDGGIKPLDQDLKVFLYHAVRELLVNAMKHSRASHINVALTALRDSVLITVDDDGVGFDVCKLSRPSEEGGPFGLFSLRERLRHFFGNITVCSEAGQGTCCIIKVPLSL